MTAYELWPFRPLRQRSLEENAQWWQECFLAHSAIELLFAAPHWTLLVGGPGSGKSVAIEALAHRQRQALFIVPYSPQRWPGAAQMLHQESESHFPQMMATAALALRDYLTQQPAAALNLTEFDLEFLRWLFTTYLGPRAYFRLVRALPANEQSRLQDVALQDLYENASAPLAIQAQIDELVCLVQALSFQRVVFTVDLPHPGTLAQKQGLADLFGWLELTHHPGFAVVAAVPRQMMEDGAILQRARGRARTIHLDWTPALCQKAAAGHIQQAVNRPKAQLTELATADLLEKLGKLVFAEFGEHAPAGWVALAETLLYLMTTRGWKRPLECDKLETVQRAFYKRHMLLRIDDESHGVWRGPSFIRLDEQPLGFLSLLYTRRGHPINWEDEALRILAGSKGNVHSLASRVRKMIEPVPGDPVYLINKRGEGGYWLEGYIDP